MTYKSRLTKTQRMGGNNKWTQLQIPHCSCACCYSRVLVAFLLCPCLILLHPACLALSALSCPILLYFALHWPALPCSALLPTSCWRRLLCEPNLCNRMRQAQFCCFCGCASENQHKDYYDLLCGTLLLIYLCDIIPKKVQEKWWDREKCWANKQQLNSH